VEVPDPSGYGKSSYRDDPNGQPYVVQVAGQAATPTKSQAPAGVKLNPGQTYVDPTTGNVLASAPAAPARAAAARPAAAPNPGAADSGQGRLLSGQGALDRGQGALALDQAKVEAMTMGGWPALKAKLDYIDGMVAAGKLTPEQAAEAKAGETDQAIQQAVTGMGAQQRAAALRWPMQESDTRATTAASTFDNIVNQVTAGAKGMAPGQGGLAVGAMHALEAEAPSFQASMGGAPVLTDAQKAAIGQHLLNGMPVDQAAQLAMQTHMGNLAAVNATAGPFTAPAAPSMPPGADIVNYKTGAAPAGTQFVAPGPTMPTPAPNPQIVNSPYQGFTLAQ
jgi:hypothetical protein